MTLRRALLVEPRFYQAPADPDAGPIPHGVHIVRGDSPGGSLKTAGAKPLIALPDNLAVGPSSRSVRLHPKVRERYWRMEYTAARWPTEDLTGDAAELLGASAVVERVVKAGATPLYLWCSGFWSDLLYLGWLLDATAKHGGVWARPLLAGDLRQTMPLGWWNPVQLYPVGRDARDLEPQVRQALLEVWRGFTEPVPERLERLRQSPPESLPTFVEGLAAAYASLLPRRTSRARGLRLSAVDEALLRSIPVRRPATFPELFRTPPSRARWPRSGLYAMLPYFGEAFIIARLGTWSVGRTPAVEQVALPVGSDPGGRPYDTSWRLTERGRKIIADGMDGPEDCPELLVGGYHSGRDRGWCCATTAHGWWLEASS